MSFKVKQGFLVKSSGDIRIQIEKDMFIQTDREGKNWFFSFGNNSPAKKGDLVPTELSEAELRLCHKLFLLTYSNILESGGIAI